MAEKSSCLADYGDFLEAQMAKAYKAAEFELSNMIKKFGEPAQRNLNQLQPSQIAFERFREKHCDLEAARAMGGSGTGQIHINCRNNLTQIRINYLRSFRR